MRLAFLLGYIIIMWTLLMIGSFILIKIIAPVELEGNEFLTSVFKGAIALLMVAIWLAILVVIKNSYIGHKLVVGN